MKKSIIIFFIAVSLFANTVFAKTKNEKIQELIAITNPASTQVMTQLLESTISKLFIEIGCSYSLSKNDTQNIKNIVLNILDINALQHSINETTTHFYTQNFSEKEIDELLTFHQSPVAKKMLSLTPQLAQLGVQVGTQWATQKVQNLEQSMESELKKYPKRTQPEYEQCMSQHIQQK